MITMDSCARVCRCVVYLSTRAIGVNLSTENVCMWRRVCLSKEEYDRLGDDVVDTICFNDDDDDDDDDDEICSWPIDR